MAWLQVSVVTVKETAETLADAFDSLGAVSVTLQDAADQALLEPAPGEHPVWQVVQVTGIFSPDCDPQRLKHDIRDAVHDPDIKITIESLEDRDWSNTWREDFHAMRFGSRLWVSPGHDSPSEPDAVVVEMDPGLAFGTGTHATTAMCLEWLDAHPPVGQRVIDYGCGSGILAIAACKLGAALVLAVDIDPQAILATRENARRNAVEDALEAVLPDNPGSGHVDLVLANILANPLIELADTLAGLVKAGGQLVMTGILAEQAEDVMAAYREWFAFESPVLRDEWVLLAGQKKRES